MSKNTVVATIPFSFKGKDYTPSSIIDLDAVINGNRSLNSIFHQVATENNVDNYSYEYEVLESSPILFSNPTGIAVSYLKEDQFDFDGFKNELNHIRQLIPLENIAKNVLGIEDLNDDEKIKDALMQAYQAGKNSNINMLDNNE